MAVGPHRPDPGRIGADELEHGLSLLEPAALSRVRRMQHGLADRFFDHLERGIDEISDAGWGADLVCHDVDVAVAAVPTGEDPRGPHHVGVGHRREHLELALKFGAAVHAERPGFVVDVVGVRRCSAEGSAEHLVGRDVD